MRGYHLTAKAERASNLPEWQLAPWTIPAITTNIPAECGCTFVWRNGQFVLKFRYSMCIEHRNAQQNVYGITRNVPRIRNRISQAGRQSNASNRT